MFPPQAVAAFFFGALSALSLVIGAVLGVIWRPPQRAVAAIMAFGAGALLAALSFELILPAQRRGEFGPVALGGLLGGLSFALMNEVLNRSGGFLRKRATTVQVLREQKQAAAAALLERLSRVPLLRALPPEDVQAIVPHVEAVAYKRGDRIYRQGDAGDGLYLIDSGEVDLLVGRDGAAGSRAPQPAAPGPPGAGAPGADAERLDHLGPGDAFGEMSCLTDRRHSATAVAATDVDVVRLPKDDFRALLAVSPRLATAVSDLLARHLQASAGGETEAERAAQQWRSIAMRYVEAHTLAPTPTDVRQAAREHAGGAPLGIFLGLLLDGIPESLVIGMSLLSRPTVSAALIVGLFLSNLPEALSSAVGMKAQGWGALRVVGLWTSLMVLTGVGAFCGNVLFAGASPGLIAAFEAAAAGAMLTMIAETALPEAYEQGGWLSGVATLLGFLAAFFVGTLGGTH